MRRCVPDCHRNWWVDGVHSVYRLDRGVFIGNGGVLAALCAKVKKVLPPGDVKDVGSGDADTLHMTARPAHWKEQRLENVLQITSD